MTDEQEIHLARIKHEAGVLISDKYRKGQNEHGGNLWDKEVYELLDNAIDEAVDQVVYLLTLRSKL